MPYGKFLGGVIAVTPTLYVKVNGYSNSYFGWGAEDDDFYRRLVESILIFEFSVNLLRKQ